MRDSGQNFVFRLDHSSGVSVYRQLMDQVLGAVASGRLKPGDQLPTIRKVAVDLAINPNTVSRSYRELEQSGAVDTQHGSGCFISESVGQSNSTASRRLGQLALEAAARAGANGFTVDQLITELRKVELGTNGREQNHASKD
ncbi:GntR family transcriptional regulator [Terriglobus sp. ADX1]